jgi:cellulose synthase/poly-beta-1,6-N-acetylglucosamine synthase-like glycosyltransferase
MDTNSGPAEARNRGAGLAVGEILLFLDSDVCVHDDTLARVAHSFADPEVDAIFGSYDLRPPEPNALSQYKNLFHRFMHQHGPTEAATFWSGCGAIRRATFWEAGGFDPIYHRSCIEDIELGMRLRRAGRRIFVEKQVQVTHLKHWSLWGLIKSDFRDRAVPWTVLILRHRHMPRAPTLAPSQRISVIVSAMVLLLIAATAFVHPEILLLLPLTVLAILLIDWVSGAMRSTATSNILSILATAGLLAGAVLDAHGWGIALVGLLGLLVAINWRLFVFLTQQRGVGFAALLIPLQLLYFLYSGVGLVSGGLLHARNGLIGPDQTAAEHAAEAP